VVDSFFVLHSYFQCGDLLLQQLVFAEVEVEIVVVEAQEVEDAPE